MEQDLEFGLISNNLFEDLQHEDYTVRINAADELLELISLRNDLECLSPHLLRFIRLLDELLSDINFKVVMTSIEIITELLNGKNIDFEPSLPYFLPVLFKKFSDNKIVIRQRITKLIHLLLEELESYSVLSVVCKSFSRFSHWRSKEHAMLMIIYVLLSNPKAKIPLTDIVSIAVLGLEGNEKVRVASIETLVVIGKLLGEKRLFDLVSGCNASDIDHIETLRRRMQMKHLPFLNKEGFVVIRPSTSTIVGHSNIVDPKVAPRKNFQSMRESRSAIPWLASSSSSSSSSSISTTTTRSGGDPSESDSIGHVRQRSNSFSTLSASAHEHSSSNVNNKSLEQFATFLEKHQENSYKNVSTGFKPIPIPNQNQNQNHSMLPHVRGTPPLSTQTPLPPVNANPLSLESESREPDNPGFIPHRLVKNSGAANNFNRTWHGNFDLSGLKNLQQQMNILDKNGGNNSNKIPGAGAPPRHPNLSSPETIKLHEKKEESVESTFFARRREEIDESYRNREKRRSEENLKGKYEDKSFGRLTRSRGYSVGSAEERNNFDSQIGNVKQEGHLPPHDPGARMPPEIPGINPNSVNPYATLRLVRKNRGSHPSDSLSSTSPPSPPPSGGNTAVRQKGNNNLNFSPSYSLSSSVRTDDDGDDSDESNDNNNENSKNNCSLERSRSTQSSYSGRVRTERPRVDRPATVVGDLSKSGDNHPLHSQSHAVGVSHPLHSQSHVVGVFGSDEHQDFNDSTFKSPQRKFRKKIIRPTSVKKEREPQVFVPNPNKVVLYENSDELEPSLNPEADYKNINLWFRNSDWYFHFEAITNLRRLALHHSHLLVSKLHHFTITVVGDITNLRSSVSRNAMICIGDMFLGLGRQMDNFVIMITPKLSKKYSDKNLFLEKEQDRAYEMMIRHCSPYKTFPALMILSSDKNSFIVSKSATFLALLLELRLEKLIETRDFERFIVHLALFVVAPSAETRKQGRRCVSTLYNHLGADDFSSFIEKFPSEQSSPIKKCIDKIQKAGGDWSLSTLTRTGTLRRRKETDMQVDGKQNKNMISSTSSRRQAGSNKFQSKKTNHHQKDPDEFDKFPSIYAAMGSSEWSRRFEAIEDLMNLVESFPKQCAERMRLQKIFGQLSARLSDANSKVSVLALTTLATMVPIFGDKLNNVIHTCIPALSSSMASSRVDVRNKTGVVFDQMFEHVDMAILIPQIANSITHSNAKVKSVLLLLLKPHLSTLCVNYRNIVNSYVFPCLFSLLDERKGDVRIVNNTLVKILYQEIGDEIFDYAKQGSMLEQLKKLLK